VFERATQLDGLIGLVSTIPVNANPNAHAKGTAQETNPLHVFLKAGSNLYFEVRDSRFDIFPRRFPARQVA